MDFFQRLGNFFTGKGWVNDDEKRRREQQVQPQPQQSQPQQVQQPQLNAQPRFNTPWANSGSGSLGQLSQPAQPKVNLNPLQQVNQATQQLNINSQNNQSRPQVTVDDAPKMLTPEGQQDWANKQNKQIQIQNAVNQPIQQPKPQPTQQPQPQLPKPALAQPQAPKPQPVINPNIAGTQNSLLRMGIDTNPVHTAIQRANEEMNQYKIDQTRRQDIIDNKMRARGVSEPEILSNRQERIRLENEANAAADQARRSRNMADIVGMATAPARSVTSFAKGAVDGAGRTVGDTGDKLALAISDAMYGITGDEKYNKARQNIVEQGKQRNAQYDKQFGVLKKNNADVDVAYELGQSGQRLVQDLGTGVATAGVVPVVRQFAENAADFVTDANAHGKNTRDVLGAAYANAAVQAAIEKVGLDKVLTPGGKTVARRMVKSALAEGGEEAAQQLTENAFAKHTYDPSRKYSEGVVKSALMGAALGGPAGAGNFGGVRQTGNHPSATMSAQIAQSQQTQQQATGKLEQEALAQRQVRQVQNQDTGYSSFYRRPSDNRSLRQAAEVSAVNTQTSQAHPIQSINVNRTVETTMPNASPALKQAVSRNISDIQHGDTNAIATRQQTTGKLENYLIEQATQNVQNTVAQDVRYKLSPAQEEYFKNSKIRDENGNLKTVYHGTNSEFDQFSPLAGSSSSTRNRWGEGNYLAYDKDMANDYGVNLKEMYANITSPITNSQKTVSFEQYDALYRRINNGEPAYREDYDVYDNDMDLLWDITDNGQWKKYAQDIKDTTGKDGVIMDDMAITFSPSQTKYIDNLNPTDGPDMRYKANSTANSTARTELEELQQSSELLARHLRLTGDERLVFNEWQNEMQRKALGYYNPETDTINLNKLSEDTLNHELGHKILERADNKQELLDTIRESYGDDYLISKYGKEYGSSDINLLAEEQLADGFSEYYNGKLHGEDAPRLAARLHIPQRIVAIYDRITEAIRGLIGKQDIIKQFYAQMETGKFRNTKQQVPGGDGRVRTMSLDSNKALETIKKFDDVLRGIRRITKLDVISNETAAKIQQATGIDVRGGASIELTNKNAIHIHNRHVVNPDDSLPLSDYDIAALPEIIKDPDTITKEKVVRGAQRIKFEREMEGNKKAIVEVIKKGNALNVVTYFNDSSSGRPNTDNTVSGYTSETGQLQSTNLNDSVTNNTQNVNTDNRYQHPLQETINDIQDNPKPKMTKELRQAIDARIAETNPELFMDQETNIMGGDTNWNIPRIHVDDLRHYLGNLAEDIPAAYRRRTGKRDIDTVAQEMGYDNIDRFVQELQRAAESRRRVRENKQMIDELRKDPEIVALAQQDVEKASQERMRADKETKDSAWSEIRDILDYRKAALSDGNTQDVADADMQISTIAQGAGIKKTELQQFIKEYNATVHRENLEASYDVTEDTPAPESTQTRQYGSKDKFGKLDKGNIITRGNLYNQTKVGVDDITDKPVRDGDWEYRQHKRRIFDKETKRWNTLQQFERRFVGEGSDGEWKPYSRAAYTWYNDKTIDSLSQDEKIQRAVQEARREGTVQDFIASRQPRYGKSGRVVGEEIVTSPIKNPENVAVDGGLVRDRKTGEVLGNHVEVTPFGAVYQVGGKVAVLEEDTFRTLKNKSGVFDTFARASIKNAGENAEQYLNLVDEARTANANAKQEIVKVRQEAEGAAAEAMQYKPRKMSTNGFFRAAGEYIEDKVPMSDDIDGKVVTFKTKDEAFRHWYGETTLDGVRQYDKTMRSLYDRLINAANAVRRKLGQPEIEYRKDYMAHIWEDGGLLEQLMNDTVISTFGIHGDFAANGRGTIPAWIVGRSDMTKPMKRFNKHELARKGAEGYVLDPRVAIAKASEAMILNTHLEPVIAKGRSMQSAISALDTADREMMGAKKEFSRYVSEDLENMGIPAIKNVGSSQKQALGDFVNALAGKSSAIDRPFLDRIPKTMRVIRSLEALNGANKIMGNISSTMAQALNLPDTVRDNGLKNTGWAITHLRNQEVRRMWQKSPFLTERYTETGGKFDRNWWQKTQSIVSKATLLDTVEKTFVRINWTANYSRLKSQGLTGRNLITQTDRATARAVGDRSLGGMPEVHKSAIGKMFLQFTYETSENWKNNMEHFRAMGSSLKHKQFKQFGGYGVRMAEAFAVAMAMNYLWKSITGSEPLMDIYSAIQDAIANANKDDEDKTKKQPILYGATVIGSQIAKAAPGGSAMINTIPKSTREDWFGKDSDFGRFEGATGVVQTAVNTIDSAQKAATGNWNGATKSVLGVVPMGNQIRKTTSGVGTMLDGVSKTDSGQVVAPVNNDTADWWKWARAAMFGKNAIDEVQQSYANKTSPLSDKQAEVYNQLRKGAGMEIANNFIQDVNKQREAEKRLRAIGKKASASGSGESAVAFAKAQAEENIKMNSGEWKTQNGLIVNKKGEVQREHYKKLAEGQGNSDEAYSNWMKAYNIDGASTVKKEFNSSNDILNKLENGEKKANKAKSAVDIFMGKHKDLPDWAKERYYKESGYSKDQIEYGAMTTHKEVSLMDNYWRQKAQESSHEELMQALTNGRRKSIIGQMFAKNGVINKLRAEGYITKWEARALNAAQFDVDGNRITKEGSGGGNGWGRGRGSRGGRGGQSANSGVASIGIKAAANMSSSAAKANQTSVGGMSINQIGQNLISKMNTQKQVNAALKQWNGAGRSKKPKVRTGKA